jgi:hypothetical protein
MHSRLHRVALVLLFALSACSANAAPGETAAVAAPRRIGGDHVDLNGVRPLANSRTDITVMVGEDGRPDMATRRVTGSGASAIKDAVTDWIARSRVEPATANGVPVRGEFRTKIEIKDTTQVRRT